MLKCNKQTVNKEVIYYIQYPVNNFKWDNINQDKFHVSYNKLYSRKQNSKHSNILIVLPLLIFLITFTYNKKFVKEKKLSIS